MKTLILLFILTTSHFFGQSNALIDFNLKQDFKNKFESKEYIEAEKSVKSIEKSFSEDGEVLFSIGQLYYNLKNWNEAIGYFIKSKDVGYNVPESNYNIACCYALNDDFESASKWLETAINNNPSYYYQWQEDTDLVKLKEDSKYLNKLYRYNRKAESTKEKWISDIDFFNDRMRQFHYHLFQNINEKEWRNKIEKLKSEVPNLEDHEIIVKLMELAALAGDGHTVVVPPTEGANTFHQAPLLTYMFQDGLYIIETSTAYQNLLGSKIVAINNIPIEDVIKRLQKVIPYDNEFGVKWLMPLAFSMSEILNALKITSNKLEYSIQIENKGKLAAHQIKCDEKITADFLESWLYGFHKLDGWKGIDVKILPSYRTKTDIPYWFEYLKDDKIVVFHYNQVQTNPDESEEEFILKLNNFIESNEVKALVIDLRSNEGGDNTIYQPILNGIISNTKINQKGRLYSIIGRRTFSAGMCFATELEKSTKTMFVGEPTGSRPNFVGESGGVFQLPYSGIYANASNLFWQNSYAFDKRKFIAPQIVIEPKFSDYILGIDAPIEAIKELILKN